MKAKYKLLITFIIIIATFLICSTDKVFARGLVSQGWIVEEGNKQAMVYRTFTTPYRTTLNNYHNTVSSYGGYEPVEGGSFNYKYDTAQGDNRYYQSKWIYTGGNGVNPPDAYSFRTIGLAFHNREIGSYGSPSGDSFRYNIAAGEMSWEMRTLSTAVNNSWSSDRITPGIANGFNSTVFYKIMNANYTETPINWGSGLKATNLSAAKNTQYRYAIVDFGNSNVYIGDNIIHSDDLLPLVKAAKNAGTPNQCYVSSMNISQTLHSSGGYELARNGYEFFRQYGKSTDYEAKHGYPFWSKQSRGRNEDGKEMGSVLNLYDNIIKFPNFSKRTVLVRHINIGNNTSISSGAVENGSKIASNNISIWCTNPDETKWGRNSGSYSGYQEYYEGMLNIDQSVTKNALGNTSTYKCIGYNIEDASSRDEAQKKINDRIRSGSYNKGTSAYSAAKSLGDNDNFVVIDFYYTEYEKDVYVNHLYVDKNGYVRKLAEQTITPNNTAVMNGRNINRINKESRISETYEKKLGYNITTRIADSLEDDLKTKEVVYRGYEVFGAKTNASSLEGKQRLDLKEGKTATLTSSAVQVNFYYYNEQKVTYKEPEKDIEGKVFVLPTGTDAIKGNCTDEDSLSIVSIPSGSQAKVGIKAIPRYMTAAIRTDYTPPNRLTSLDINVRIKLGSETKTVKYSGLKYRAGYYKVTDMLVYKLTNTTVYDADRGYPGTLGDSMFSWSNGQLSINPKPLALNIVMTGINNKTIANNSSSINNIDNYVSVSVTDKNGVTSGVGSTNTVFEKTYLTTSQIEEVDANSDGVINSTDKTYANNLLKEYKANMDEKERIKNQKYEAYLNTKSKLDRLYNEYKKAETEKNRLYNIYIQEQNKSRDYYNAYLSALGNASNLYNKIQEEEKNLIELDTKRIQANQVVINAQAAFNNAEQERIRLNNIYLESLAKRNELERLANCTDTVPDDVYIYLEQSEKDELEQCKKYKEEYAKHIEDRVVEKAQQSYDDYYDDQYIPAENVLKGAKEQEKIAIDAYNNKTNEVINLRNEYVKLDSLKDVAYKIYIDHRDDIYLPAKDKYNAYVKDVFEPAKKEYDDYNNGKYVQKALDAYNLAVSDYNKEKKIYDDYNKYVTNLLAKYPDYKAKYDEYIKLSNSGDASLIASTLGLKVNIKVQNMIVKVNGVELAKPANNTASKTIDLKSYINSNTPPQILADEPSISKDVYSNIGSTKLVDTDYTNANNIVSSRLNGVRVLAGKAEYLTSVVIGSTIEGKVEDNVYYADENRADGKTAVFGLAPGKRISKEYQYNGRGNSTEEKYKYVEPANIYTPITVTAKLKSDEDKIVDQTQNTDINVSMIQHNTPFTVEFDNGEPDSVYRNNTNHKNTSKYKSGYYIKFDFDVHKVTINGKTYKSGSRIPAGTWIGIVGLRTNAKSYVTAQAYANTEDNKLDILSEEKSSYTVRSVAYNATSLMKSKSMKYNTLGELAAGEQLDNICKDPSYFAEKEYNVVIINRVYDFRITDLKDLNWKSVFRKSTTTSTNIHTKNLYYAGTTKWNSKSEKVNSIISRTAAEIGRNPLRILPLGPYKNTNSGYIKAPKLGYRFSFDMKVSGSYYNTNGTPRDNKKVDVLTKFYYVSKNGKTYYNEYTTGNEGIYLFYKNSSGQYIRIDDNGGGYNLSFTPNDGYRYIEDTAKETLSKQSLNLGNLRRLTLNYQMATSTNNSSAITYYGEYKLPNSTIAVKVNADGSYDINKPLKNGYIGVIFDIVAYSGVINTKDAVLSYSKDTKVNIPNTSQWDYEGFLGYTGYGREVKEITLQLENGKWTMNNNIYNKIKGSVILYDTDERAATDYE